MAFQVFIAAKSFGIILSLGNECMVRNCQKQGIDMLVPSYKVLLTKVHEFTMRIRKDQILNPVEILKAY